MLRKNIRGDLDLIWVVLFLGVFIISIISYLYLSHYNIFSKNINFHYSNISFEKCKKIGEALYKGYSVDCDRDGLPVICDNCVGGKFSDKDNDGVIDECDIDPSDPEKRCKYLVVDFYPLKKEIKKNKGCLSIAAGDHFSSLNHKIDIGHKIYVYFINPHELSSYFNSCSDVKTKIYYIILKS